MSVFGKFKAQLKLSSLQCFKILNQQRRHFENSAAGCMHILQLKNIPVLTSFLRLPLSLGCRSPTSTASRSAGGHRSCAVLEERAQSASSVIGTFRVKILKKNYLTPTPPKIVLLYQFSTLDCLGPSPPAKSAASTWRRTRCAGGGGGSRGEV